MYEDKKSEVTSQLIGAYNFENILAAICMGNVVSAFAVTNHLGAGDFVQVDSPDLFDQRFDDAIYPALKLLVYLCRTC